MHYFFKNPKHTDLTGERFEDLPLHVSCKEENSFKIYAWKFNTWRHICNSWISTGFLNKNICWQWINTESFKDTKHSHHHHACHWNSLNQRCCRHLVSRQSIIVSTKTTVLAFVTPERPWTKCSTRCRKRTHGLYYLTKKKLAIHVVEICQGQSKYLRDNDKLPP